MITHPWCEERVVNPNNDLIAMFTTPHVTDHLFSIELVYQNINIEVKSIPQTKSSVATFSRSKSLRPGLVHTCKDAGVVTKTIVRVMKMLLKIMLVETIMAKLLILVLPHTSNHTSLVEEVMAFFTSPSVQEFTKTTSTPLRIGRVSQ